MSIKDIREGWLNYMKRAIGRRSLGENLSVEVEKRAKICSECPYLKIISKSNNRIFWGLCKRCGCVFPALVYSPSKSCPENKWNSIPDDKLS